MSHAVLKEILQELKGVKTSQERMEDRLVRVEEKQDRMDERLIRVEEKQDRMDERLIRVEEKQDRMDERQSRMENDITDIKVSVKRIEENEPQEVLSLLKIMNRKMDHFAIDVEYLKEKTGKHDAEINLLNKLTQS